MSKERLETFSDGVFAIAITLLVLTIAQPSRTRSWPIIHLARVDRGMFYLNLTLLMTIAFNPYPTEVFGESLRQGRGAKTAAVFYSAVMVVNAFAWAALWLYASVGRRVLKADFSESQRRMFIFLFNVGALVYLVSIGVAFIDPYVCLAFHGGLAVYYAFDPISRRVERGLT